MTAPRPHSGGPGYVNWEKGEPNNYGGRDEEATFMNPPPDLKAYVTGVAGEIDHARGKWAVSWK